jgi:uracil-DNA glycosylase
VAPCFPADGPVRVLLVGEAPGPRGADKSGVPFWGDRAGAPLYRALAAAGACVMPAGVATLPWDGAVFAAHGLVPALHGVAVGNAYDRCPSDDGQRFRAPSRAELESVANRARLALDIDRACARGLREVIAMGRVAARLVERVLSDEPARWPGVSWHLVPHPSAQGLLSAAPERGRGARLAELAAAWEAELAAHVRRRLEEVA